MTGDHAKQIMDSQSECYSEVANLLINKYTVHTLWPVFLFLSLYAYIQFTNVSPLDLIARSYNGVSMWHKSVQNSYHVVCYMVAKVILLSCSIVCSDMNWCVTLHMHILGDPWKADKKETLLCKLWTNKQGRWVCECVCVCVCVCWGGGCMCMCVCVRICLDAGVYSSRCCCWVLPY